MQITRKMIKSFRSNVKDLEQSTGLSEGDLGRKLQRWINCEEEWPELEAWIKAQQQSYKDAGLPYLDVWSPYECVPDEEYEPTAANRHVHVKNDVNVVTEPTPTEIPNLRMSTDSEKLHDAPTDEDFKPFKKPFLYY